MRVKDEDSIYKKRANTNEQTQEATPDSPWLTAPRHLNHYWYSGAQMFANRLTKKHRAHAANGARQQDHECSACMNANA